MSEILTHRRGFITGLISFVAAPAIVRAGSLMPVKATKWMSAQEIINLVVQDAGRRINPPWGCDGMSVISLEEMKRAWDRMAQFAVIPRP